MASWSATTRVRSKVAGSRCKGGGIARSSRGVRGWLASFPSLLAEPLRRLLEANLVRQGVQVGVEELTDVGLGVLFLQPALELHERETLAVGDNRLGQHAPADGPEGVGRPGVGSGPLQAGVEEVS